MVTAKSCWKMPKSYWKAAGQFINGIGKLLGNAQIPPISQRRGGRIVQQLSTKEGNFCLFPLKRCISVSIKKSKTP
jgi:hypothetical protein